MFAKLILLCFFAATFTANVSAIIYGRNAELGELPYQVALKNATGYYFCGGAILNSKWILTVQQCLQDANEIFVQAGSRYLDGETEIKAQTIKVQSKIKLRQNPNFYDPALLKLETPLKLNALTQPILLPINITMNGHESTITAGWGPTLPREKGQSNILKFINKTINDCLYPDSFCVDQGIGGVCFKDHGSPVVLTKNGKTVAVGVVSDLRDCNSDDSWFRVTNLTVFVKEIESIINKEIATEIVPKPSNEPKPFEACSDEVTPFNLKINGSSSNPYVAYKGGIFKAQWDFAVDRVTSSLTPKVFIPDFEYFYEHNKDGCLDLQNAECPLKKGQNATYKFSMPVYKFIPPRTYGLQIWFTDQDQYPVFCFKISVDIKNPERKENTLD